MRRAFRPLPCKSYNAFPHHSHLSLPGGRTTNRPPADVCSVRRAVEAADEAALVPPHRRCPGLVPRPPRGAEHLLTCGRSRHPFVSGGPGQWCAGAGMRVPRSPHMCVAEKVLPTVTSSLVAQTCCWWGVMTVLSATFASLLSGAPPLPCDYATLSRRALDQLTMNRGS